MRHLKNDRTIDTHLSDLTRDVNSKYGCNLSKESVRAIVETAFYLIPDVIKKGQILKMPLIGKLGIPANIEKTMPQEFLDHYNTLNSTTDTDEDLNGEVELEIVRVGL